MRFELMSGSIPLSCPAARRYNIFQFVTYLDYCNNSIKASKSPFTNLVAAKLSNFLRAIRESNPLRTAWQADILAVWPIAQKIICDFEGIEPSYLIKRTVSITADFLQDGHQYTVINHQNKSNWTSLILMFMFFMVVRPKAFMRNIILFAFHDL